MHHYIALLPFSCNAAKHRIACLIIESTSANTIVMNYRLQYRIAANGRKLKIETSP